MRPWPWLLTRFDPISEETCSRQRHRHRQECGNDDDWSGDDDDESVDGDEDVDDD